MFSSFYNAFIFFLAALVCAGTDAQTCQKGNPVVMVPGIFGTILHFEANIPPTVPMSNNCARLMADARLWVNAGLAIHYSCFYYYLGMSFDSKKQQWQNTEGVNISIPKWGTTYAVDTLDPSGLAKYMIPYFHQMIQHLGQKGYIDGVNMVGAGFDWRAAPTNEWARKTMTLIEDIVDKNQGKPAILVAHSMGAPYSYFLLQTAGDQWTKKYIKKLFCVSPAWMGAPKALDFMFDGFEYKLPIAGRFLAPLARHIPSCWVLLPRKEAFKGMTLATSPDKNYTFDELEQLMEAVNATDVKSKIATTRGIFDKWDNYAHKPPVPVISYIGTGLSTVAGLVFEKKVEPCDPEGDWTHGGRILGDGDGTVPIQSLRYPTDKWAKMGGAEVKVIEVKKGGHVAMLRDSAIVDALVEEAC